MPIVRVRWLDSQMRHDQVDDDQLPVPGELDSVGWLSYDGEDHIVLSRDHAPDPGSYSWRSNLAIPRAHIVSIEYLTGTKRRGA